MPTQRAWETMAVMCCCQTGMYVCPMKACWSSLSTLPECSLWLQGKVTAVLWMSIWTVPLQRPPTLPDSALGLGGQLQRKPLFFFSCPCMWGNKAGYFVCDSLFKAFPFDEPASQNCSLSGCFKGFLALTCWADYGNSLFHSILASWDKFSPLF